MAGSGQWRAFSATDMPDGGGGSCTVWRLQHRQLVAQLGAQQGANFIGTDPNGEPTFNTFIGETPELSSVLYDPIANEIRTDSSTLITAQGPLPNAINLSNENRLVIEVDPDSNRPTTTFFLADEQDNQNDQDDTP